MQLLSLYIKKYNHLVDFKIDFKKKLSVIIGVNGSGKSSILEVLAQIFSDAYLGEKASLGFKLTYTMGSEEVIELSADDKDMDIKMNGNGINDIWLPDNIVVYYSGLSDKMEKICEVHEKKQADDFRKGHFSKRSFFYYRPKNFKMFLLSLFAYEYGETKDFILRKMQLTGLKKFGIEVVKPKWAKDKAKAENLWGLTGINKDFCDILDKFSDNKEIDSKENSFIRYKFDSIEKLYAIKNIYIEEKRIFEALNMLLYEDILGKSFLLLEKDDETISSNALSEGEKQIIAIRGINDLLIDDNTLLLFDEPDTYLHPSWQSQFIEEIIKYSKHTQFVITTHSPQILTNMNPQFGHLNYIENGKINDSVPHYYGRDINAILYNLMDTEERNIEIENQLTQLSKYIALNQLEKAEKLYTVLVEKIGADEPKLVAALAEIDFIKAENE